MKKIFSPTISLMNHLKYPQKMLLMAFIFFLPLATFMYLLISEINGEIKLAEKERQGAEYNQSVIQYIKSIQQHRGMANAFLNGDASFKEKIILMQSQIEKDIKTIDNVDKKFGPVLKTTDKWNELKERWQVLKKQLFSMKARDCFNRHTMFIRDILGLMVYVADVSKLTLEPEMDTYYLMDTVVNKLPLSIEYAGQIRGLGAGAIVPKKLTAQEKAHLIVLSGLIRSTLEDVMDNMNKVFQENANIKPRLEGLVQKTISDIHDVLEMLDRRVIYATDIKIEPSDYFNTFTEAMNTGFKLHDSVTSALHNSLLARTKSLTREKRYIEMFVLLALIVLIYLFMGYYFSVMNSLSNLMHALRRVARGDLTVNVSLKTKDEMSLLANSFNHMTQSLNDYTSELKKTNEALQREIIVRKQAEERIKRDYHIQNTINSLLQISLKPISLIEQLRHSLDLIVSIQWFILQQKGCIFLIEDDPDVLVMQVQRGFSDIHQATCSKLPLNICLCGKAAATGETIFATDHVDDSHEIKYAGMQPHGHYIVPIKSGADVLGVICLYINEGHKRDVGEEKFLSIVANTLAGIIERKRAEEELRKHREHLEDLVEEQTAELTEANEHLKKEIIEHVRTTESLVLSEEKFRKITTTAQDAIIMMDNEGDVSYWNPAAEKIFDYTEEEAMKKYLHKLIVPDRFFENFLKGFERFRDTGKGAAIGKTLELSAIRRDGTEFPIELSLSAVKIKGKWHAIGIVRDIIDRKKAEECHATIGLAVTQIAHGTKNILNALQGGKYMVETALRKNNLDLIREGWDVTKIGISRVQSLTRDLLDCSRFSELDLKPACLTATVQEIIRIFQDSLSDTDIEVLEEIETSLPEFMFDHNAVHSALMNLVSNAIDSCRDKEYEEGERGKVIVRTYSDNGNGFANLEVEDNGCGIKLDEMEKIFNLFYSTKASKGNGLGLPITKKVVEQHGGSIEVNSELRKGTIFLMKLPLKY